MEAEIYFSEGVSARELADALLLLPPPLAPIRFSEDEDRAPKANLVSDERRFSAFVENNSIGFFLFTEDRSCIDIQVWSRGHASISLDLKLADPDLAEQFLEAMAAYSPAFGYAGVHEERRHRNYKVQPLAAPDVSCDSYIGRDLDRYVSGVYWQTLLSADLIARHGIDIEALQRHAASSKSLAGGTIRTLKFFNDPGDWRDHAERLDALCESTPGIFSRRILDAEAQGVTDWDEYSALKDRWE